MGGWKGVDGEVKCNKGGWGEGVGPRGAAVVSFACFVYTISTRFDNIMAGYNYIHDGMRWQLLFYLVSYMQFPFRFYRRIRDLPGIGP